MKEKTDQLDDMKTYFQLRNEKKKYTRWEYVQKLLVRYITE